MMFEKSYYLEPDSKSPKAYVLLRRALEDTDRVAIVQFALREKTRLGALRIKRRGAGAAVAAVGRRGPRGQLSRPGDVHPDLRPGTRNVRRPGGVDGRGLRAGPLHRRLPGSSSASSSRRSWKRASRWTPTRPSAWSRRGWQGRSHRPDGSPQAQPREKARGRSRARRTPRRRRPKPPVRRPKPLRRLPPRRLQPSPPAPSPPGPSPQRPRRRPASPSHQDSGLQGSIHGGCARQGDGREDCAQGCLTRRYRAQRRLHRKPAGAVGRPDQEFRRAEMSSLFFLAE